MKDDPQTEKEFGLLMCIHTHTHTHTHTHIYFHIERDIYIFQIAA